jgi:hypothetical protein
VVVQHAYTVRVLQCARAAITAVGVGINAFVWRNVLLVTHTLLNMYDLSLVRMKRSVHRVA